MQLRATWTPSLRVWCFDVEARPGPWGGGDFTFKHMLSIAGGYQGGNVDYLGPGFKPRALERFVRPLREPRTLVVGHNLVDYDLPLLNGTLVKLGLQPLPPLLVQDTFRHLTKTGYAFSKSLGNLSKRFDDGLKGGLSEYDWEQVYAGVPDALEALRTYNIGDVLATLELRRELLVRNLLRTPRVWRP